MLITSDTGKEQLDMLLRKNNCQSASLLWTVRSTKNEQNHGLISATVKEFGIKKIFLQSDLKSTILK